jgi:hypothetical protein
MQYYFPPDSKPKETKVSKPSIKDRILFAIIYVIVNVGFFLWDIAKSISKFWLNIMHIILTGSDKEDNQ